MDWVSIGCCLLSFILYYNTLDAGFVYDDRRAILTNPDLLDSSPFHRLLENDFWGTPLTDGGSHGSYRPLCVFTFRLNYAVDGFHPRGYHLVNVLMHCLAVALVVRVARELLPPKRTNIGATVAGLTFASHPIHTEAVAGIVGRADVVACIFFLLSFLSYIAHTKCRDFQCCEHYISGHSSLQTKSKSAKSAKSSNGYIKYDQKVKYSELVKRQCLVCDTSRLTCRGVVVHIIYNIKRLLRSCEAGIDRRWPLKILRLLLFNDGSTECIDETEIENSLKLNRQINSDSYHKHVDVDNKCNDVCAYYKTVDSNISSMVRCCVWWNIKTIVYFQTAVIFAAAAMFSKETGVTALLGCAFYDIIKGVQEGSWTSKKRLHSLAFLGLSTGLLLSVRLHLIATPPQFATADNPTARDSSIIVRILTFSYLPVFNFILLVFPATLSFDWSMDSIPKITSLLDPRNLVTVVFYLLLFRTVYLSCKRIWLNRRRSKTNYDKNIFLLASKYGVRSFRRKSRQIPLNVSECGFMSEQMVGNSEILVSNEFRCSICRQSTTNHHSISCRTLNNNNYINHSSSCCCNAADNNTSSSKRRTVNYVRLHKTYQEKNILVALLMAISFLTVTFLPATNLLFYVGFVVAERVIYLPSVGYCLLLGIGASRIGNGKWCNYALLFLVVAFSAKTVQRNRDWKTEESLFRSAINVNPPKAYGNLGSILSAQGRDVEAESAFHRALIYRPNMADVHYNLGILQQRRKRYEEAIKSFESAIKIRPSLALAYVNLGASLLALGRCAEAAAALSAGAQADGARARDRRVHDAARASALVQLGALHAQHGRHNAAVNAYQQALDLMPPDYPSMKVYNLLGETYMRLSRWSDAERAYLAAVEADSSHVPAHLSFAKMLAKNDSRVVEAEQWFRRAMKLAPDDAGVHRYYGDFLASQHRFNEAADQFIIAANSVPTDLDMAAATATALREAGRRHEAELWYKKLAEMNPNDARSHTNLGAILHLNGKFHKAAASYRQALKLQPNDVTTIANLRKLHAIRSKNVQ